MLRLLSSFIKEEDGLGTVEIVVIIAVLIGIALIFRNAIIGFVKDVIEMIFGDNIKGSADPTKM